MVRMFRVSFQDFKHFTTDFGSCLRNDEGKDVPVEKQIYLCFDESTNQSTNPNFSFFISIVLFEISKLNKSHIFQFKN